MSALRQCSPTQVPFSAYLRAARCAADKVYRSDRAARQSGPASLLFTPQGFVMTEDTMRQLLMAHLSSGPLSPEQVNSALETMVGALRRADIGGGDAGFDGLMEAISRSMQDTGNTQAPPASATAVAGLKKYTWQPSSDNQECSICLFQYGEVSCIFVRSRC